MKCLPTSFDQSFVIFRIWAISAFWDPFKPRNINFFHCYCYDRYKMYQTRMENLLLCFRWGVN